MSSTLYHHGVVHSRTDPFAQAVLVVDGQVAWLGAQDSVHAVLDGADEVVDLDGALVTPAFVDADVQVLATGAALVALDLSAATSREALLDAVAARVRGSRATGPLGPVTFVGWNESGWPDPAPPSLAELDRAADGAPVHLLRSDGHGALVSSALADQSGCADLPGWDGGWVTGAAHERALKAARPAGPARREDLHRRALGSAAAAGIASLHDLGSDGPVALAELLTLTRDAVDGLPRVHGYPVAPCETVDDVRALLELVPDLAGVGLRLDGALGSRTAALRRPYADAPTAGALSAGAEQVANHVAALTRAGHRAVLLATGDRALDEVLLGVRTAADVEGGGAVRGRGHHVVGPALVDATALANLLLLGLGVTLAPAGAVRSAASGEHLARLGPGRAGAVAPLADLAGAGVPLALGSGAPSGPFDPWAAVRAAIEHPDVGQRVSARAAFRAHTRGGWRLAGLDGDGSGEIRVGAPAHLAIWRTGPLAVQAPDGRLAAWSTDARAGTPLLPELGPGLPAPVCLRTVRSGVVIFDTFG